MKKEVVNILKKSLDEIKADLKKEEIENLVEIPPSVEMGDYAFPCFTLAKKLRKTPSEIASELKRNIKAQKNFSDIQVKGAYINFFADRKKFAKNLISEISNQKDSFGKNSLRYKRKTMVEFSQPNTHKAFHVGHIRGTSVGESIARILEFSGEKVMRANYSGDTGMHVAKWIWCYKKYHSKEKLKKDESWIASIYVDAVKRLHKNEKLQEEVNEINRKLDSREDRELNKLWEKTRKLSIDSWKKIYNELNTHFDEYFFESQMEKKGKEISLELEKKGIAKKSDGAIIMDLQEYNLGVWVLLRSDGTVLYSAKDLALAKKKIGKFNSDKYIVVVGDEQKLHFLQLRKTLELMNVKNNENYDFLTYGMIRLPKGKMSSRTGDNILYSDFMSETISHTEKEIKKRETKIEKSELNERALKIAVASIKYSMLKQGPNKNIIFKKEDALNFEGDSGAYILYTYARANSILRKSKIKSQNLSIKNIDMKEIELLKKLSRFPDAVSSSYNNLNPSFVANYSYQLAQLFNEFYHSGKVIGSENESFRISLVKSFLQVLKNSMNLLGIEVIEKM